MRICLDVSPLLGEKLTGVGEYIFGIINAYSTLNIEKIKLFAFVPMSFDAQVINQLGINQFQVQTIRIPSKLAKSTYMFWQLIEKPYIENIIGSEYDIYHVFDWYTPPSHKIKVISTVYDMTTFILPRMHKSDNVSLQRKRLSRLSKVDGIVCISESTKRDLIKLIPGVSDKKMVVAYPGVKHAFLKYKPINNECCRPFILVVGTKEPRKNISTIIDAFIGISNQIDHNLVVVGATGWGEVNLRKHPRVIMHDYISNDELAFLYCNCKFTIYLSRYEGFGLPIIESLFFGKNVVTGIHSALQETCSEFGIKIQNTLDVEEIQKAIIYACKICDEETLIQIERRKSYAKRFSYEKTVNAIVNLYKDTQV